MNIEREREIEDVASPSGVAALLTSPASSEDVARS